MGVTNPTETMLGILQLIDKTREKMAGTELGGLPWRPMSGEAADVLTALVVPALEHCDDVTEAVIAVTVGAVWAAKQEAASVPDGETQQ